MSDAETLHDLAHLRVGRDVMEALGEDLLRGAVRVDRAQLREHGFAPAEHLGVCGARDRVAEDKRVGRGRVLHAAQHGQLAGGGHAGLAQVYGVVHVGDRSMTGIDCPEAGQDEDEDANPRLDRPTRRFDLVVDATLGEDPLQGPGPGGMQGVDDRGDTDRHENRERDVFDAHDASGVLVPGGQQVRAQRRVGRVGEARQAREDQVGDERPERQGQRLVLVGRGRVFLVRVRALGESGLFGGTFEGVGAAQESVQAGSRGDARDEENQLDERPVGDARRARERRVGQEGVGESLAPTAAIAGVLTHGLNLGGGQREEGQGNDGEREATPREDGELASALTIEGAACKGGDGRQERRDQEGE